MKRIAVLGAGSWGTALSLILARSANQHAISLWVHDPSLAESLQRHRENPTYLPGFTIPERIRISHELSEVARDAHVIVGAIPAAYARAVYTEAASFVSRDGAFVSATKGLEPSSHKRMSEVLAEVVSSSVEDRFAVLSGPSFAVETARDEPVAVVLASHNASLRDELQEQFATPSFRLYTNDDVLGVELAGATKNVIAIAAGACQGLGLGSSSVAALITRGLTEMSRLAAALGGKAETLSGLAGLGDLVLTCTGSLSRNRYVGVELGKGRALPEILAGMRMIAEGVGTASALLALAREAHVEMPITEQVEAILHHGKSPRDAIRAIMNRPLKRE